MNVTVRFLQEAKTVCVPEGTTLLEAQAAAGLAAEAPCGGRGVCGKCAVDVRREGEAAFGRALACQTRLTSDVEVRRLNRDGDVRVLLTGKNAPDAPLRPMTRLAHVQVPPCPRGGRASDWARLCDALGLSEASPSLPVCAKLGTVLHETKGDVHAVLCNGEVLEVSAGPLPAFVTAFDLGTTTLAGYLMRPDGTLLASRGAPNPQSRYGADVITRAGRALTHGVRALSECVRDGLSDLLSRMCRDADAPMDRVVAVMLAGNTAMHHLFLGIAPDSLVRAPYNPVVNGALVQPARAFGLNVHPQARLFALPVIGGFVGADTVACLLSGGWERRERLTLLIDIGTNGEIVLGSAGRRIACSTAAGPALEGALLSCGMSAVEGAIDRVWLEGGRIAWHAIGGGEARGLCGSGVVDLIAALLRTGALEGSGRLSMGDRFQLEGSRVFITQKDVREVQLAKAAIAAGILLLCERLGVSVEDIEAVELAGAFGSYIDCDNACAIGLLPAVLRDRIATVGNAAGAGARMALLDEARWREAERLARSTEFLELATLPEFQEVFVDQLAFSDEDD